MKKNIIIGKRSSRRKIEKFNNKLINRAIIRITIDDRMIRINDTIRKKYSTMWINYSRRKWIWIRN